MSDSSLSSNETSLSYSERSSRPEVFCTKGVLKNFAKFTGKRLCQSLFFNEATDLRPATLLKKRLWHKRFPVDFAKFLRTSFLQNTSSGCFWTLFLITPKKYCMLVFTNLMGNKPWSKNISSFFWYWCWKNLFFNVKLKILGSKCQFLSVSWTHLQKQPFADVLQNRCPQKFRNSDVNKLIDFLLKIVGLWFYVIGLYLFLK